MFGIGKFVKQVGTLLSAKKIYGNLIKHIHDPNRTVEVIMPDKAVVEIKPAYQSGINWAAVATFAVSVLKMFGADPPTEMVGWIEAGGVALASVFIFIKRTWFTTKITPSSAAKVGGTK